MFSHNLNHTTLNSTPELENDQNDHFEDPESNPNPCDTVCTIDSLPPEIFLLILKQLDLPGVRLSRQICKKWQTMIDHELPKNIIVDDRNRGNCDFAQNVVKKKVKVKSLQRENTAFRSPKKAKLLEKLEICGKIHPNIFTTDLKQFPSLKCLLIGGETFLQAINLTQKIFLPNLEMLNLSSPFKYETTLNLKRYRFKVQFAKNTTAFLKNVCCTNIKELIMDGDVDQYKIQSKYDWKRSTIIKFIQQYGSTLRRVLIGESNIFQCHSSTEEDIRILNLPKALRSLHFSFSGNQQNPWDKRMFWYDFLLAQRQLEHLNVGLLWFRYSNDILARLPITIRHISIYWNLGDLRPIDAGVMESFVNLQRLELTFDGAFGEYICNLYQLQKCTKLKIFITEQLLIPADDLECFPTYLPNLEVLYISNCADIKMDVISPFAPFGITSEALSNLLWSMNELVYLSVSSKDFLGDSSTVKEMRKQISKVSKPVGPDDKQDSTIEFSVGREPTFENFFTI